MASLRPILMKLRGVNFQESMGHEGSNERASDSVRRDGCPFRFKKKEEFLTIFFGGGKSP